MKCYYHPEKDAVALCKSCHRALCRDCASEVPNGVACKGKCEEEAMFLNEMVQRNKGLYAKTANTYYRSALINLIMALVFAGFGAYTEIETLKPFLYLMGGVMFLAGILTVISAMKFKK